MTIEPKNDFDRTSESDEEATPSSDHANQEQNRSTSAGSAGGKDQSVTEGSTANGNKSADLNTLGSQGRGESEANSGRNLSPGNSGTKSQYEKNSGNSGQAEDGSGNKGHTESFATGRNYEEGLTNTQERRESSDGNGSERKGEPEGTTGGRGQDEEKETDHENQSKGPTMTQQGLHGLYIVENDWQAQSKQLKEKYPQLTAQDLEFEKGRETELLSRIESRLDKSREDIIDIIKRIPSKGKRI